MSRDDARVQRVRARPLAWSCAAGIGYSLGLSFSVEPFGLWAMGLVGLAWLAWAWLPVAGERPVRTSLALAAGTLPVWAWTHGWVFGVAWPGAVGLWLQMAVYIWVFAWLTAVVHRRWGERLAWLVWPVLWCGVEWLRSEVVWGGYAWYVPAQALIDAPMVASAAGVIGLHGVGLLAAVLAACVAGLAAGLHPGRVQVVRPRVWMAGAAATMLAWGGLSWWGWAPAADGPGLRVAAVQTAVPQSVRGVWKASDRLVTMERLIELSKGATQAVPRPDVVVWPETLFPGDTLEDEAAATERRADLVWLEPDEGEGPTFENLVWRGRDGTQEPALVPRMAISGERRFVSSMVCYDTLLFWQGVFDVPMLVGADGFVGLSIAMDEQDRPVTSFDARYNSVHLLRGGRVQPGRYDKQHLTPFGEVMPVLEHWPWLEDLVLNAGIGATGMRFDLARGNRGGGATRFVLENEAGESVRVATPVCFEVTSAGVCRGLVAHRGQRVADVFVGLTNDGWFSHWPVGRRTHLRLARWRSVETWTPMVRAANTGVSAWVDQHGRLGGSIEPWQEGVLAAHVRTQRALSPYARGGFLAGWIAPICTSVVVALLAARRLGEQRRKRRDQRPAGD